MTDPSFWDTRAEAYAAKPVEDPAAFERKQAVTREHLAPDHVVLDVGCGTGSLALLLAPHAREVHGLDVSGEMVRIARSKAEAAGVGNVTFHQGLFDGSFEALVPGSLDMVCAYSLLHLVPDRADALARAFALLKPGGTFVSSTVCLGSSWVPYRPLLTVMRWAGQAPYVAILTTETLVEELAAAGFEDVRVVDVGAKPIVGFIVARRPSGAS
ncbi:MAG: class I SAM-dependent methyltransferase [Alphaproteobacteria bacterium]|nr:class I SAM-dependent methyltransferase [Alphaproteobacteria bacterium]MCB9693136.1 class I SAM-dependent methyltransferase [Alphaproteobacteria bacterium]